MSRPRTNDEERKWQRVRRLVLERDRHQCVDCGVICRRGEADVHHVIPRALGGTDEPANLITLCDGCHAAYHPNFQAKLSRRLIERWALRLARWLDRKLMSADAAQHLGAALRLLGVSKLRDGQLEAILAALRGESVLMVSPTGSGKTLCFQAPAVLSPGTTLVISPLKALMSDQVSALQRKKVPGTFINGDLSPDEKELRYELATRNALKFLYCTPERFDPAAVRPAEVERMARLRPSFLVVDEAHCIDKWGRDFRPSYARLGQIRRKLGGPPALAFTATAGFKTQRRILDSLEVPNATVVVRDVDRPNIALLRLRVDQDQERYNIVAELLRLRGTGRAMIFVPTVRIGETLAAALRTRGLDLPLYHSKLSPSRRENILKQFSGKHKPVQTAVICTSAFGMGLDVPDVRLVIHWQHPASVEDYLQEFGRAGRDGRQALAVLFVGSNDVGLLQFMSERTLTEAKLANRDLEAARKLKDESIHDMRRLVEGVSCFRWGILHYFDREQSERRWSLALALLRWIFGARSSRSRKRFCCDACSRVTMSNWRHWADQVLQDSVSPRRTSR